MNETKVSINDRHVSPYSRKEKIARLLWSIVQKTLFRWTWVTDYRSRRFLLRLFGANISATAHLRRTITIECPWNLTVGDNAAVGDHAVLYCLGPIKLGERATVSQYAQLCGGSHDYRDPKLMPLLRLPITIQNDAWIAADAFVGPGVTVGQGAILGARGCAFKDMEPWTIYGGNPAKAIKPRAVLGNQTES